MVTSFWCWIGRAAYFVNGALTYYRQLKFLLSRKGETRLLGVGFNRPREEIAKPYSEI